MWTVCMTVTVTWYAHDMPVTALANQTMSRDSVSGMKLSRDISRDIVPGYCVWKQRFPRKFLEKVSRGILVWNSLVSLYIVSLYIVSLAH